MVQQKNCRGPLCPDSQDNRLNKKEECMGKGKKSICKWDKDEIKDDLDKLKDIVIPPKFICLKCGRVAKKGDYLCKPEEL
jgi:hypothetical protein